MTRDAPLILGFGPVTLEPGATVAHTARPQVLFTPTGMLIAGPKGKSVDGVAVSGIDVCGVAQAWMVQPAFFFHPNNRAPITVHSCPPGEPVTVHLTNNGDEPVTLHVAMVGRGRWEAITNDA